MKLPLAATLPAAFDPQAEARDLSIGKRGAPRFALRLFEPESLSGKPRKQDDQDEQSQPSRRSRKRAWFFRELRKDDDLDDEEITAALLGGRSLQGRRLAGYKASQHLPRGSIVRSDLSGAHLHRADFSGIHFEGVSLDGAQAPMANFSDAAFVECSAREMDLTAAMLAGATLSRCNFSQALFRAADARRLVAYESKLVGVSCGGADLREASFEKCDLQDARMASSRIDHSEWVECDMRGMQSYGAEFDPSAEPLIRDPTMDERAAGSLAPQPFPGETRADRAARSR